MCLQTQVPGHVGLAYLNKGIIDDVMEHRGVVVQGLPINHTKSPDRWKNVCAAHQFTTPSCNLESRPIDAAIPVSTTACLAAAADHQDAYENKISWRPSGAQAGRKTCMHAARSCGLLVAGQ